MMFIRSLLILVIPCLLFSNCKRSQNDFSESLRTLQKSNKDITTLYFYQGTLKMLNFNNDSAFNLLIKDIKKVKLLSWSVSKDSVISETTHQAMLQQIQGVVKNLKLENFVSLMQYRQEKMQVMLFLKKHDQEPVEFVGLFYDTTNIYVIDMVGKISLKALPAIFTGKMNTSGFQSILNIIKPQSKAPQSSQEND